MNSGVTWKKVTEDFVTGKSYQWPVPKPTKTKTGCFLKVNGYNNSNKVIGTDRSDRPFTIEVVKLTSLNGGEPLVGGEVCAITWATHETIRPVMKARIYYSRDGGTTWKLVEMLPGDPRSYDWAVPNVTSNKCKVKVVLKDAGGNTVGSDVSDALFPIHASQPQ